MTHNLWTSDKFRHDWKHFVDFVQAQANRLAFGAARYEKANGGPNKRQRYVFRLTEELKAYKRTGNREHLLNIANYAWLETQAPENPRYHWDNTVGSATRGKV